MSDATPTPLQQWLAAEEAVRQRQRAHAQPTFGEPLKPEQVQHLSGLQALQAMVAGELRVPGWSTYLHPWGDRLVTVGIDDVNGRRVAAQLFDVSDAGAPLCGSGDRCPWQKSSIITYNVVRKGSLSTMVRLFIRRVLESFMGAAIPSFQGLPSSFTPSV